MNGMSSHRILLCKRKKQVSCLGRQVPVMALYTKGAPTIRAATIHYPWVLIASLSRISPRQGFTVCEDWAGYEGGSAQRGGRGGWGVCWLSFPHPSSGSALRCLCDPEAVLRVPVGEDQRGCAAALRPRRTAALPAGGPAMGGRHRGPLWHL